MYFYIGIFIFCTIMLVFNSLIKKQRHKIIFEIMTIIVLCIISGTRYYLGGSDYGIYKAIFEAVPSLKNFNFMTIHNIAGTFGAEKGYLFLCSVIKSLNFNFWGFTLIHSIIFYTCMYVGIKKYSKNFNLVIIVFLYKMFFYDTFISLRQSITIAIFFVSLHFIENKKFIPYFLCCMLAVTFHNGALILFLVYFINKFELTKRRLIILNCIFIPTIIISYLNIPILSNFTGFINLFNDETARQKATNLINTSDLYGIRILHTIEYLAIMVLVIKNYSKIIKENEHAEFILKLFTILLPLFTLFRGYEILTREKDYFLFTYAIIFDYLCRIDKKKYCFIVQSAVTIICFLGFLRYMTVFENGSMIPYQTYLTKNISIFTTK